MDGLGAVEVGAEGAWLPVVVSGAFGVVGAGVVEAGGAGVWVCVVGLVVVQFGACANAAVAKTTATVVLMRKRVFISGSSGCDLQESQRNAAIVPGNMR